MAGENIIAMGLGSVQTWECDVMGHPNVQYYIARAMDALPTLALALGLGPRHCRDLGAELGVADHHVRFLKELRPRTGFTITVGLLAIASDTLRLYREMRHTLDGTGGCNLPDRGGCPSPASGLNRRCQLKSDIGVYRSSAACCRYSLRQKERYALDNQARE